VISQSHCVKSANVVDCWICQTILLLFLLLYYVIYLCQLTLG